MATSNGLTFTIGQITWTTGFDDFITMTPEEVQVQSALTTASPASATALTTEDLAPTTVDLAPTMVDLAPTMVDLAPTTPASSSAMLTTRRPLPRYKGKQIDNTVLLNSIDRVGTKLAETLALVSSIQSQPNE